MIVDWMEEDERNVVLNEDLHELANLGTWLVTRVRNYVQTRQKDIEVNLQVPKEWHDWFHHGTGMSEIKAAINRKFQALIWTGEKPSWVSSELIQSLNNSNQGLHYLLAIHQNT